MSYQPQPIDTSKVVLPAEIALLTEQLAKNAHDNWAKQRMGEGWVYGPKRDDPKKEHPCLVPYEQLTETEREYDRITALGTLQAIVKLGYRIEPPS